MLSENLIKGQIIELKVQIELLRYGFDISVPSYNASKYDLIVDTGKELLKIQVKKSRSKSLTSFTFDCYSQNVGGAVRNKHKYTADEVDYFATVWEDKVYLIPIDETSMTKTIQFSNQEYLAENVLSSYKRLTDEELYNQSIKKNSCEDCGCSISTGAKRCVFCQNKAKSKNIPSKEELKQLIRTIPFTQIGKQFNVSDNAVRKWCDKYNLPRKKSEIEKITEEVWNTL